MSQVMGRAVSGYRRSYRRDPVKPTTPVLARRSVVLTVVLLFAITMAVRFGSTGDVQPAPAVEEAGAGFSLVLASELIEQYRNEHGELPESLADVGLSDQQLSYRRVWDGSFELEATVTAGPVRYDSNEGPEELLRMMGSTSEGGS